MSDPRVIVVGGTGFLGRHVLTALRARLGPLAEIIAVGRRPAAPEGADRYVRGDRADPHFVRELMALSPEYWFDLALFEPREMEALVEAAAGKGRLRLVTVAGTIAEYGLSRPLPLPLSEDHPLDPESGYGRGKVAAWQLGHKAHERHGFPLCWGVLPQLWGPGDPHGRDARFVRRLLDGEPVVLRGNGRTLLPDGYVETVAQALVHLGLRPASAGLRANVAGRQVLTPLAFVRAAADALGCPVRLRHVAPREMAALEQMHGGRYRPVFGDFDLVLDLQRLHATGFAQHVVAAEGVARTARWHAAHGAVVSPAFALPSWLA